MTAVLYHPLYTPSNVRPMRVIVFASGGGGNLKAAIDASLQEPSRIQVCLVVTDRLKIPAIDIAKNYGIPIIARDFEKSCGVWAKCQNDPKEAKTYTQKAIRFHDRILFDIQQLEHEAKVPFDLVVLSYHRWIRGKLLHYFEERMINQHAGDLTVMRKSQSLQRKYIGINPVLMSLSAGEKRTRTSTFVVRAGDDNGEILCQGPWVRYTGSYPVTKESAWKHEVQQKQESDWPSLRFTLHGIAWGDFGLAKRVRHSDGCKIVIYRGHPLPYGGVDIETYGKKFS